MRATGLMLLHNVLSASAVIVALINGVFLVLNTRKMNAQARDLERFHAAVNHDLELLKSQLARGEMVTTTQWNAEFSAYQRLWKAIVPVRGMAHKLIHRSEEFVAMGLNKEQLNKTLNSASKRELLTRYTSAVTDAMFAVHENAPFYESAVREAGEAVHQIAYDILQKQLRTLTSTSHLTGAEDDWRALADTVNKLEVLIRQRMSAVQVMGAT